MDINTRIGSRLLALRQARGWSLDGLAERSGVGRSTISQIERGSSSPTAVVLDRLCTALGVALASLFDPPEAQSPSPLARREEQVDWVDPATGYRRRQLSPSEPSPIQLVEVWFPAGQRLAYDTAQREAEIHQQIWLLSGQLSLSLGPRQWDLGPGDCLAMQLQQSMVFHNPGDDMAHYLVALVRLPMNVDWRRP